MDGTSSSVLLILAVLPAVVVMFFVWKMDKREKEPFKLLLQLFGLGALSTIFAIILELVFSHILSGMTASWIPELPYGVDEEEGAEYMSFAHRLIYQLLSNFIGIALVEEAGKFMMLHLKAWKSPEFDYSYDAVVYAVATSLGFATVENVLYVFMPGGGLSVALLRAVLSVPGHAIFAVFMGWFYGRAKYAKFTDNKKSLRKNMWLTLLVPTALHGFYDFCLTMGDTPFVIAFFIFEIAVMIVAILLIRHLSNYDQQVAPPRIPPFIGFPGMPGYPGMPMPGVPFPNSGMPQPFFPNQMAPTFSSGQLPVQQGYPQTGMMRQPFMSGMPQQPAMQQQNPAFRGMPPQYGMPPQPMYGMPPQFGMPPQNPAFRPPYGGAPGYPQPQNFFAPPPRMPQGNPNNSYPNGYARANMNANARMEDLLAPQGQQQTPTNPQGQHLPQTPMNPQNLPPQMPVNPQNGLTEQAPQQPVFPQEQPVKEPVTSGSSSLFTGTAPSNSLFQASHSTSAAPEPSVPVFPAEPVLPAAPVIPGSDSPENAL